MFQAVLYTPPQGLGNQYQVYDKFRSNPKVASVDVTRKQHVMVWFRRPHGSKICSIQISSRTGKILITYQYRWQLADLVETLRHVIGGELYFEKVHPLHWGLIRLSNILDLVKTSLLIVPFLCFVIVTTLFDPELIKYYIIGLVFGISLFIIDYTTPGKKAYSKIWSLIVTIILLLAGIAGLFEANVMMGWLAICGTAFIMQSLMEMLLLPSKALRTLKLLRV